MKIKLSKNWRYAGQVIMAGTKLDIKNEMFFKKLDPSKN